MWWAIEDKALSDREEVLQRFASATAWQLPIARSTVIERLARRYLAERSEAGYAACARILEQAPTRDDVRRLVQAMEQDLSGPRLAKLPAPLAPVLEKLWREDSSDPTLTRLALRLGSDEAFRRAESRMSDRSEPQAVRLTFISAVGQSPDDDTRRRLLPLLDETQKGSEPIRMAVLAALEHDADPSIAEAVLAHYASWPPGLRARAITLLASRKNWSEALLRAVERRHDRRQGGVGRRASPDARAR